MDLALRIGGHVLDGYFGGDLEEWRSGQNGVTLRQLAREARLGVSASTLYRYVAITALCRRMGRTRFDHLGTSHLRLVLSLPLPDQVRLVTVAEAERWTVRQLASRVLDLGERAGRRRSTYAEALGTLRAWLRHPSRAHGVATSSRAELTRALRLVRAVREELGDLEEQLVDALDTP
jgi:AcrR family transcriptional regulator